MITSNSSNTCVTLVCLHSKVDIVLSPQEFTSYFQPIGSIKKVKIDFINIYYQILVFERYDKKWKSFIQWEDCYAAKNAIEKLNQTNLKQYVVKVFPSQMNEIFLKGNDEYQIDFTGEVQQSNKFHSLQLKQIQRNNQDGAKSLQIGGIGQDVQLSQIQEQMNLIYKEQQKLLQLIQSSQTISTNITQNQQISQPFNSVNSKKVKVDQAFDSQQGFVSKDDDFQFEIDNFSVQDSDYEEGEVQSEKSNPIDFDSMVQKNLELFKCLNEPGNNQGQTQSMVLEAPAKNEQNFQSLNLNNNISTSQAFTNLKVVFVRWFNPQTVTMDMLYNIFSTFGNVEKMIFFKKKSSVLLQFEHVQSAQFLINNFSGVSFQGQRMKVFSSNYKEIFFKKNCKDEEYFESSGNKFRYSGLPRFLVPPTQTIKVTNLKIEFCSEEYLAHLFSQFGKIDNIKVESLMKRIIATNVQLDIKGLNLQSQHYLKCTIMI